MLDDARRVAEVGFQEFQTTSPLLTPDTTYNNIAFRNEPPRQNFPRSATNMVSTLTCEHMTSIAMRRATSQEPRLEYQQHGSTKHHTPMANPPNTHNLAISARYCFDTYEYHLSIKLSALSSYLAN